MKEKNEANEMPIISSDKSMSNKNTPIQSDLPKVIPNVNLVTEFLQFAQWMATPRHSRKQKTQKDFANEIGVSQDTLTAWKCNPYFWPLFQKFTREWIRLKMPDVINGLYKKSCNKGNAKDVLAFLKLGGISDSFNEDNKN